MTTDRGRWLPLVPEATEAVIAEHHLYEGEDLIREAAEAQRDADWQVVEELVALAEKMAQNSADRNLPGYGWHCRFCERTGEERKDIVHHVTCPVGRFLALKERHDVPAPGPAAGGGPEHP